MQPPVLKAEGVMQRAPCSEEFGIGHRRKPGLKRGKVRCQAIRFHVPKIEAQDFEALTHEHRVHIQGDQQGFEIGKDGFLRCWQFRAHQKGAPSGRMRSG